jgi:hypothetical protein
MREVAEAFAAGAAAGGGPQFARVRGR